MTIYIGRLDSIRQTGRYSRGGGGHPRSERAAQRDLLVSHIVTAAITTHEVLPPPAFLATSNLVRLLSGRARAGLGLGLGVGAVVTADPEEGVVLLHLEVLGDVPGQAAGNPARQRQQQVNRWEASRHVK